jgi:serine protease
MLKINPLRHYRPYVFRKTRVKKSFRAKLLRILITHLFVLSLFAADSFSDYRQKYVPGEIIVKFKDGTYQTKIHNITARNSTSIISTSAFAGFHRIKVPAGKTAQETVELFKADPDVEYAELNCYVYAHFVPNDPLYYRQWNFKKTGGINIEPVWDLTTGDPNVIIAVLDTGVAYEDYGEYALAPDLANTHFVAGHDYVNEDSHPNDDEGHGTHVTGTIAQSTNNLEGVAGVAFNCSIMPVKVLNINGSGYDTTVADGIYFAVDHGAKIINMSFGGAGGSFTLRDAVAYAYNHGVTCVCSAGNEYLSGNPVTYPAAYNQYCIAVGATRYDRTRAYYSNTGSYIDLVAPGGDLNVDQDGDGFVDGILQQTFDQDHPAVFNYYLIAGTSMAAPHVSAVAGLLVSTGITEPDEIREVLQNTAIDLGNPGRDNEYGYGLIDAFAAIRYFAIPGDFNFDGLVDLGDLKILCDHWLQDAPGIEMYPSEGDGIINFLDYAVITNLLPQ